tara:strand:+ start:2941 stop:3861 length:921 start_codon:yes stop_codon:yes gene_type:complete
MSSVCFIGTSFFSMGQSKGPMGAELDFVDFIAKRHKDHKFINLSIPGVGFNFTPNRVNYALNNFDPDLFIIELTTGVRNNVISTENNRTNHSRYYRVKEIQKGILTHFQREQDQFIMDGSLAQIPDKELEEHLLQRGFVSGSDDPKLDSFKRIISFIDPKFTRGQWINMAGFIQDSLLAKGKKVIFVEWQIGGQRINLLQKGYKNKDVFYQSCEESSEVFKKLITLSTPWPLSCMWAVEEGFLTKQELDSLIGMDKNELDKMKSIEAIEQWRDATSYDGTHLSDEYLRKYSATFDQILWDFKNGNL